MQLIATCAFGLEKLVYQEIKRLGLWVDKTEDGRVTFQGEAADLVRANLWLRTADRVHIRLAEFPARTFDELFDQSYALDWTGILPPGASFPVLCTTTRSALHNEPAIQSIVKKSIVKKLQPRHPGQEQIPETGPTYSIMTRFHNDICTLSLDSSGESLHKRGYRTESNQAPIKETLAAAMVLLSDWATTSQKIQTPTPPPTRTLIDPFCGSGTILIEAAMIALNIAPGVNRQFAFDSWPEYQALDLRALRYQAASQSLLDTPDSSAPTPRLQIYGYDIDALSVKIAQANSTRAGLEKVLHFAKNDFRTLDFARMENVTIITNPPYGERLATTEEATAIYRDLGEKFRQTSESSLYIITPDTNFELLFGARAAKNRKLFNGNIKCYLYQYPTSPGINSANSTKGF